MVDPMFSLNPKQLNFLKYLIEFRGTRVFLSINDADTIHRTINSNEYMSEGDVDILNQLRKEYKDGFDKTQQLKV